MKKFLACLSIAFVLITPVFAQDYGLGATADAANLRGESNPTVILGKIIGAGLSLIGIVFFVLTLYAGITWMVARGNEESAKKAINTIIAAAIGMIITMSAYAITSFILEAANQSALGGGGGTPTSSPAEITPTGGGVMADCTQNAECQSGMFCVRGKCATTCQDRNFTCFNGSSQTCVGGTVALSCSSGQLCCPVTPINN